jgi:predicted porin
MKKSLLALAVMGAFVGVAQAQSSVTIYGVIDTSMNDGIDKVNLNGTTTTVKQRSTGAGKDGFASSRLGIRGVEDLGGGMSASFVWEQGLVSIGTGGTGGGQASTSAADADVGTAPTAPFTDQRQVYVGLADRKMGEIRLGRQATGIHNVIAGYSAGYANNVAGALYSAAGSVNNSARVRPHDVYVNRTVGYISPVTAGFQVELQVASQSANSETNTTQSPSTTTAYNGARLTYTGVKDLSVGFGYSAVDLNGASADVKKTVMAAGASYNFGPAQVFGLYTKATQKLASNVQLNDQTAWELGVRAPISKTIDTWASILGGSSTGTGATSSSTLAFSSTAVSGDVDISGFQLGAKYNFSKRTGIYAVGGTQTRKGTGVSSASKNEATQVALGVNHTF